MGLKGVLWTRRPKARLSENGHEVAHGRRTQPGRGVAQGARWVGSPTGQLKTSRPRTSCQPSQQQVFPAEPDGSSIQRRSGRSLWSCWSLLLQHPSSHQEIQPFPRVTSATLDPEKPLPCVPIIRAPSKTTLSNEPCCSKGSHEQNKKTTHRMGENIS